MNQSDFYINHIYVNKINDSPVIIQSLSFMNRKVFRCRQTKLCFNNPKDELDKMKVCFCLTASSTSVVSRDVNRSDVSAPDSKDTKNIKGLMITIK